MKKLVFTLPASLYEGILLKGEDEVLVDKYSMIGDELYGTPAKIWRAPGKAYELTSEMLKEHIDYAGDRLILPPEDIVLQIVHNPEFYRNELVRIAEEIENAGDYEGIVLVSPSVISNALPSVYARRSGFEESFVPWLTSNDILVLDAEKGTITKRSFDYGPLTKNLKTNPRLP
ncbi:MAG: hypothetical protein J7K54_03940 [Candidatus Aenigmarchaeota archaeon]|nr:hypothetical protein [Candidatus Aenigmarchaeota archaeon]